MASLPQQPERCDIQQDTAAWCQGEAVAQCSGCLKQFCERHAVSHECARVVHPPMVPLVRPNEV